MITEKEKLRNEKPQANHPISSSGITFLPYFLFWHAANC